MTNAKRLTFIWKRQTVGGKRGESKEKTWSSGHFCRLPFAVNAMLNLPIQGHQTASFGKYLFGGG